MLAAEVGEESMVAAEGEAESMLAAEGKGALCSSASVKRRCRIRDCRCCWEYFSPTIRVDPATDYVCIPDADADADHLPAWSLLVGVTDGASSLQVSRFRVARSGRILGRSDDALEVFHNIVLAKPPGYGFEAGVAPLAPDGRSLLVLHNCKDEQPKALQLNLQPQADPNELPLPEIEGTNGHCILISAEDHIWAMSADQQTDDINKFSVVMRRLVLEPGGGRRWEVVSGPLSFTSPLIRYKSPPWSGWFLQGYAVLPDANLILVSFQKYGLFLTFDTRSGRWTHVLTDTDKTRSKGYLPIFGRGIYIEQHKAVCILRSNIIYAYKLTYQKDDHGTQQLKLDLPVKIDSVYPFIPRQGYGFLTRLTGHLMCSVWISLARHDPCPCDSLHAIVTTFDLPNLAQGGIKVLHCTYRRIDMEPDPAAHQKFCFLQEYEDQSSPVLHQHGEDQEDLTSSQHVEEPSEMLSCCRNMVENRKYRHIAHSALSSQRGPPRHPPLGLSRSLLVEPASRQHQVCSSSPVVPVNPATETIKKDLYIICQAGSQSVIYQTGAMGDDVKPLEPCYFADVGDHHWHFYQSGSKIHAVSSLKSGVLDFSLNKDRLAIKRPVRRPTARPFVVVVRVGQEIIALTETLQVYHQTQFNYGSTTWLRYMTDESDVVGRRVVISGYVAVNDDSFIVCDAVTCSCLLFDLGTKQWRVVMPWAAFKEDLPTNIRTSLLNGRCVFVDGFIYTWRNGGLAAYELLSEEHSVYLSKPILLPLSSHVHCVDEDMHLDYAGKDVSGANLFYVVQGGYSPPKHGVRITTVSITTVSITTVKVKSKRTASNVMKPVGIDHVGSVTRFIHHNEAIDMRCCFAVSCL